MKPFKVVFVLALIINLSTADQVDDLLEEYFQWKVQDFPGWSTSLGIENAPVKLDNYSLASFEAQKVTVEYFNLKANNMLENDQVWIRSDNCIPMLRIDKTLKKTT